MAEGIPNYRLSKKTRVYGFRLPPNIADILERRAINYTGGVSEYVRYRMTYDLTRKHQKSKNKE